MARPQQEAACALGEHKSSHSCHQTSQSPAGVPGGEIRAGKHILFLLLEVPSSLEMNLPSVPPSHALASHKAPFYTLPLSISANKSQGQLFGFSSEHSPFDSVQPRAFFHKVLFSLWPHRVCTRHSGTLSPSGRVTRHLFRPEIQPLNGPANKELLSKQTLFILVSVLGCHQPHASPCRTGHSSPLGLGSRPPPTVLLSRPKRVINHILIDAEGCRGIL